MTKNYSVGENVEAWCSKCKSEREHTIAAMVDDAPKKVVCNTCKGQHNFRAKPAEKRPAKPKTSSRKAKSQESTYEAHLARLTGGDVSKAKKYSMQGNFKKDEVLDHTTFGIGIVLSVMQRKKIEVLFRDEPKIMIQNY